MAGNNKNNLVRDLLTRTARIICLTGFMLNVM